MSTYASIVYGADITHIGSGASILPQNFSLSTDISTALSGTGNLARYPLADVILQIVPTASINSLSAQIYLYRRDLDISGTADESIPNSMNPNRFVGRFIAPGTTATTGTYTMQITNVELPGGDCEFYTSNQLGVNMPAGWTLTVRPKTLSYTV